MFEHIMTFYLHLPDSHFYWADLECLIYNCLHAQFPLINFSVPILPQVSTLDYILLATKFGSTSNSALYRWGRKPSRSSWSQRYECMLLPAEPVCSSLSRQFKESNFSSIWCTTLMCFEGVDNSTDLQKHYWFEGFKKYITRFLHI